MSPDGLPPIVCEPPDGAQPLPPQAGADNRFSVFLRLRGKSLRSISLLQRMGALEAKKRRTIWPAFCFLLASSLRSVDVDCQIDHDRVVAVFDAAE